jgi:hypothetical protein
MDVEVRTLAEPRDINERIGLDYLVKAGKLAPPEQETTPDAVPSPESAYDADIHAFAARAVLKSLQKHEQEKGGQQPGVRLSEISTDLGMSAETLLPLCRSLESIGMLRTLERSTFGDNEVTLTDRATQLLSTNDEVALLRQLKLA